MTDLHLVLITAPADHALALADSLVEQRLAACVNILPGVRSIYRWQGRRVEDDEQLLICKTTAAQVPALEAAVLDMHPYETPEVVAIEAAHVQPRYAAWIDAAVRP